MKLSLDLTPDELEWLGLVIVYGGEITEHLLTLGVFGNEKKWDDIQHGIYEKMQGLDRVKGVKK